MLSIDREKCSRCKKCVEACPEGILLQEDPVDAPHIIKEALCISCGHCVALCEHDAISHSDFPQEKIHPIQEKRLVGPEQLRESLRARRSVRVFKDKPVAPELLEKVIEAARLAPSSHNFQNTHFTVVQDPESLQRIEEKTLAFVRKVTRLLKTPLLPTLIRLVAPKLIQSGMLMLPCFEHALQRAATGASPFLHKAPALILFHGDPGYPMSDQNAQIACQNATLMAQALGLGSFYIGFVVSACEKDKAFTRQLGLPDAHVIQAVLAVGHPQNAYPCWPERGPATIQFR